MLKVKPAWTCRWNNVKEACRIVAVWKRFCQEQFLERQRISFRAKVCDQNDWNLVQSSKLISLTKKAKFQTHQFDKESIKNAHKALKIQKNLWEGPSNHLMRGSLPPSCPLPSLVPSALDGLFCQTTFKCSATALVLLPKPIWLLQLL